MSRSFKSVPHRGNLSDEARARFRRGHVPTTVGTADGVYGVELWTRKAKRVAKRQRAKQERRRGLGDGYDD